MHNLDHGWDLTPEQARELQEQLAPRVIRESDFGEIKFIAGLDSSYKDESGFAAVALISYPELELLEYTTARRPVEFPYVPGLFSFREAPVILEALEKLKQKPDLLIFDGQGLAHPRRFGIASHLGLYTGLPSIGCAKTRLIGEYDPPGSKRGDFSPMIHEGETVGAALRTRDEVKPLFISSGHRVNLEDSMELVLGCCREFRQPETTRWANRIAAGDFPW